MESYRYLLDIAIILLATKFLAFFQKASNAKRCRRSCSRNHPGPFNVKYRGSQPADYISF